MTLLAGLALLLATVGQGSVVTARVVGGGAVVVALLVIAAAAIRTAQARREYDAELATWAAERAAQSERLRVARDLHDLASHGLGLITVRAAAAARVDGPEGERERVAALADIEQASRAATGELRQMLGLLRAGAGEQGETAARWRPPARIGDLSGIVAQARRAGLTVRLEQDPALTAPEGVARLSTAVQQTICAVVREGLANVARHAGPTRATVRVTGVGGELRVEVVDEGPAAGWQVAPGAGLGLVGLRERLSALGGELSAGPEQDGFRLLARLPDGTGRMRA